MDYELSKEDCEMDLKRRGRRRPKSASEAGSETRMPYTNLVLIIAIDNSLAAIGQNLSHLLEDGLYRSDVTSDVWSSEGCGVRTVT